jgi:hypothetical protein
VGGAVKKKPDLGIFVTFLIATAAVLTVVAFVFAVCCGMAWLTMVALSAVGAKVTFWQAFAIYFVLAAIFGGGKARSKSDA